MTNHERERSLLEAHLLRRNLKRSTQRDSILEVFLGVEQHVTAEKLHQIVREKYPTMGLATIYRTLSLFRECGLCRELRLDDGTTRYERTAGKQHHDHLICTRCGRIEEVVDADIERLQDRLYEHHGFQPQSHRMDLYGICGNCLAK